MLSLKSADTLICSWDKKGGGREHPRRRSQAGRHRLGHPSHSRGGTLLRRNVGEQKSEADGRGRPEERSGRKSSPDLLTQAMGVGQGVARRRTVRRSPRFRGGTSKGAPLWTWRTPEMAVKGSDHTSDVSMELRVGRLRSRQRSGRSTHGRSNGYRPTDRYGLRRPSTTMTPRTSSLGQSPILLKDLKLLF